MVSKRAIFETFIIILLVSSKLGDIIAKFSYILLPQIKNDCSSVCQVPCFVYNDPFSPK